MSAFASQQHPIESDDLFSFLRRVHEGLPSWYGHASLFVAAIAFGLMIAYTAVSHKIGTTAIYVFLILLNANVSWLLLRRFYKRSVPSRPSPSSEVMLHNSTDDDDVIADQDAATSAVNKQSAAVDANSAQAEEEASKKKLASQLINVTILTLLASTGILFKVMAGPATVYFAHFDWPLDLFCVSLGLMWTVLLLVMCRCVPKASTNNINLYIAAFYTALFCLAVGGVMILQRHRMQSMEPLRVVAAFSDDDNNRHYSSIGFYAGEAYARGVELTYNETGFCEYQPWKSSIPVQLDVYFGGSWACPFSDQSCQVTIDAEVPCTFWDSWFNERLGRDVYDDSLSLAALEDIATPQDYLEYTVFRYHSSDKFYGDDDNPYGFDDDSFFDLDSAPTVSMWNRPSETIVGNCNTCEAMSMSNFSDYAREVHSLTMCMYTLVGAAVAITMIGGILDLIVFNHRRNSADDEKKETLLLELGSSAAANGQIRWV